MKALVRRGTLAAALALLAVAGIAPTAPTAIVHAMGPLPACRYDDILTAPRQYAAWSTTLVDTILRVSRSYVPPDLVSTSLAGIKGGGKVRAVVIDDLKLMTEAAAAAGNPIAIQSAYRSYEQQEVVFAGWVAYHGYDRALELSARPGHSEHQLGVGIDFRTEGGGSPFTGMWQKSAAGRWMAAHAWEYGFVMSYPKGTMDVVCYDFEPWHFRYVGRELAASIVASGLTPREYLWANFTTAVVPAVTPRPTRPPSQSTPRPTAVAASAPPGPSATPLPIASPSAPAPTAESTPSAEPTSAVTLAPTAQPTAPSADPSAVVALDAGLAAAIALALSGVLVLAVMVLRRGRFGAGL